MQNEGVYTVKLTIRNYLEQHNASAYRLWKASGLPKNTAYALASGKTTRIDLDTLGKVVFGLEQITGKTITPNDVLEVIRDATQSS
jgi:DNA-binding Xre family transcriptional regulator